MAALHVVERGPIDAPVIALVHGSMDRASGMWGVARRLQDDFHVVMYDRRGYARSRGVGAPFGIDTQVDDLVGVLATRPSVVFGHSHGGNIALAAAQRRPDLVHGVGAYEPPMAWEPWWPSASAGGGAFSLALAAGPEAAAEAFLRRMIGDRVWSRLPETTREERRAEGVALVGELADLRRGPPYDPDLLRVPVLLARGESCAPQHLRAAGVLAERFGSPARAAPATLVVVPGAGHGIHLEDPAALAELVRRLAAGVTAG